MILGILLFVLSFVLVFSSSYLITSLLAEKNSPLGLLYLPIIAFSQIVLTFEILSLFSAIKIPTVLLMNILITVVSYHIWNKKNKPCWGFDRETVNRFFVRIKNSLKLDKTLIILAICYLIFICVSVFLCLLMPVSSGDGKTYHAARSFFYILNGNLNHFVINDIRALCLPINSEILYSWIILFIKKDVLFAFFSFTGYVISMLATFNLMGYLHFSYRRRLWVIFILSSFSSVLVQASGTETDIIIIGLITSAIYMFWTALKTDKKIPVFMAALSYALAIGTKTPSIIMIPAVGFFMLSLCFHYKKFKPLFSFLGFGVVNFLIFSSYNYILNFIDYKNIAGPEYFMVVSKNYYGIKGVLANFIKYIFMFFDFTGFRWSDFMMNDLVNIKDAVLGVFGLQNIKDGLYTSDVYFQRSLIEQLMGAGILGFITFLPCWIWSFFKIGSKNKTQRFLGIYAFVMLINLIVISFALVYMAYSVRFVMAFLVLSSPVLAYSYFSNKNPLKYIMIYFSIYYLVCVTTHIWVRPFFRTVKALQKTHSVKVVRQLPICNDFFDYSKLNTECKVRNHIQKYSKDVKILYIPESGTNYVGLGKLMLQGYKIDLGTPELESFMNGRFDEYDLIIIPSEKQRSTIIMDYENRKDECVADISTRIVKCPVKKPYNCFYEYNNRIDPFDKSGKLRSPFAVTCIIKPEYLNSKDFELSRILGAEGRNYNNMSPYYLFFQNKNKSPKLLQN